MGWTAFAVLILILLVAWGISKLPRKSYNRRPRKTPTIGCISDIDIGED